MSVFETQLKNQLFDREQQQLTRQRLSIDSYDRSNVEIDGKTYINFSSNDYLGLANDFKTNQINLTHFGSGGSHLISGHHQAHTALEKKLAIFLQREAALTFSTGYMANIAILQTLAKKGDLIIADKLNHASLIDGAKLSEAEVSRYRHCDISHLEKRLETKLKNASSNKWVVTDSLFSMDGDLAPLDDISKLCKKYDANLIIDDAHGFGILGKNGRGACEQFGLNEDDCPVLMSTMSKALGGYGALVSGKQVLIDYLMQFARPYIYTTAAPSILAELNLFNLNKLILSNQLRKKLAHNIQFFKNACGQHNLAINSSNSAIQIIELKSVNDLLNINAKLFNSGFVVGSIRPPTVKTSRLRVTLSASHTEAEIDSLVNQLARLVN